MIDMVTEERKAYMREYMRKRREKSVNSKSVNKVVPVSGLIADDLPDPQAFTGAKWFYLLPGEFEKLPSWIKLRVKTL